MTLKEFHKLFFEKLSLKFEKNDLKVKSKEKRVDPKENDRLKNKLIGTGI